MAGVYSIELMTREQVVDNWARLSKLLAASVVGNSISRTDMDSNYILSSVMADEAVIFAGFINGHIEFVLAIQFSEANGHKCADVLAMAGRKMTRFKAFYWDAILDWLRGNGVRFLDTLVPQERTELYRSQFGFDHACTMLRKELTHG